MTFVKFVTTLVISVIASRNPNINRGTYVPRCGIRSRQSRARQSRSLRGKAAGHAAKPRPCEPAAKPCII